MGAQINAQMFPPDVVARINQPLIDYRNKMDALANEDAGKFWCSVIEFGMQEPTPRTYRRRFQRR